MSAIPVTPRTEITRLAKRGTYDRETIHAILDEALVCTIAFVRDGAPFQIPTGFARMGEFVYIHGSVGSTYMRDLAAGKSMISLGVTLIDGIVLARSAFHHSVNYRSVVVFGHPVLVTDRDELYKALELFTNKMCPGRWDDVRKPTENEWKATMVLKIPVTEASAKVRTGPPKDDEEDYTMDVWAGVQTIKMQRLDLVADPVLKEGVAVPGYLR